VERPTLAKRAEDVNPAEEFSAGKYDGWHLSGMGSARHGTIGGPQGSTTIA
jgi:hypothetical protein